MNGPALARAGLHFAVIIAMERRTGTRPQTVLLVEDSTDIRELWRLWLTFWGFSVVEASNGREAVDRALSRRPDLILMDLWMPVVDGVEAIKRLRAHRDTAAVPIIALSAQSVTPTERAAADAGANAFISKPCDPDVLLDSIRLAMSRLRPQ